MDTTGTEGITRHTMKGKLFLANLRPLFCPCFAIGLIEVLNFPLTSKKLIERRGRA